MSFINVSFCQSKKQRYKCVNVKKNEINYILVKYNTRLALFTKQAKRSKVVYELGTFQLSAETHVNKLVTNVSSRSWLLNLGDNKVDRIYDTPANL